MNSFYREWRSQYTYLNEYLHRLLTRHIEQLFRLAQNKEKFANLSANDYGDDSLTLRT